MTVDYINMTSSYDKASAYIDEYKETISRPVHHPIKTNKRYRIRNASGLSFYLGQKDYVWMHYIPTDLIF